MANRVTTNFCNLISSTVNLGYTLHITGFEENSDKNGLQEGRLDIRFQEEKPKLVLELLRKYDVIPRDAVVVFCDGFDVLAHSDSKTFLSKYDSLGKPDVLFSGESYCFPWDIDGHVSPYCSAVMAKLRPDETLLCGKKMSRWKWVKKSACAPYIISESRDPFFLGKAIVFPFINTGLYVGKKRALNDLLSSYLYSYKKGSHLHGYSDQAIIHDMVAKNITSGFVDQHATMLLNMCCPRLPKTFMRWEEGIGLKTAFQQNKTNFPAFIHWSGNSAGNSVVYKALASMHKKVSMNKLLSNMIVHSSNPDRKSRIIQECGW